MLFIIVILQAIIYAVTCIFLKDKIQKISLLICNIAFFLYSCVGIASYQLAEEYYTCYMECAFTFNIFFIIGDIICCWLARPIVVNGVTYGSQSDYILTNFSIYLKFITLIYFAARILWLIYPEFYLKYMFAAPNFIYRNALDAATQSVANPVGKLLSTLTTITLPFALIYIRRTGKKMNIIYFFLFDLYAQYLIGRASIGRLAIIRAILITCFVFYLIEPNKKKRVKYITFSAIAILFSFIIYMVMENWRNGNNIGIFDVGLGEAITHFIDSELYYPSHYPLANALHSSAVYPALTFWAWLFTMPIPKLIFNVAIVDPYASVIYRVFTYYYWGGHWGNEHGYAGMLLSVMGDGILVYGVNFAFILVIPFAFFIGFFLQYLLKIKYSEIMYCSTLFFFFVSFRPGVQYALQNVNTFVGMIMIIIFFRFLIKSERC